MTARQRLHTVEEAAKWAHEAFWRRWEQHPEMRARLRGRNRVIVLELADGEPWTFHIEDGKFTRYEPGGHPRPDARLVGTTRDLLAVFNRELPAMQAWLTGRLKIKASLGDVLFVKNLVGDLTGR